MSKISLVLSDVDGTLVTHGKQLTEAAMSAVRRLGEAGIGFSVTSSRPAFGLRHLVEPLSLVLPLGAYNGGLIVNPDFSVVEEHLVPADAARTAIDTIVSFGADVWLFADERWLYRNPDGDYIEKERRTLGADPVRVEDFEPFLGRVAKIVGVSADFEKLAECERVVQTALAGAASAARSQKYYLDVTPPGVDKGTVVEALSRHTGVPVAEIAVLGDMDNDVAMFRKAGFSIAMGNASEEVQREAKAVTDTNDEDGFAKAIDRFVLSRAAA